MTAPTQDKHGWDLHFEGLEVTSVKLDNALVVGLGADIELRVEGEMFVHPTGASEALPVIFDPYHDPAPFPSGVNELASLVHHTVQFSQSTTGCDVATSGAYETGVLSPGRMIPFS
jgi:hypothetical protein